MIFKQCTLALLALAPLASVAPVAGSAEVKQPVSLQSRSPLLAQFVKTGLFVISGGGCNSVLRLTQNGFVLVDGQLPGNYDALMKKVRNISFSDQPVRALILTDYHDNHSGNNTRFLAAGTQILANQNVKPVGGAAIPSFTYDHEYKFQLGGVAVHLLHPGSARTSGDTVVYFPNLKVVAVGDLYSQLPDPDYPAGGSLVNWGPALGEILKLDFDTVVPGNGPVVTRTDLAAFKTKIDTVVKRASALVNQGVPKDQLMARLKTDDLGWRLDFTGERLDRFYAELAASHELTQ